MIVRLFYSHSNIFTIKTLLSTYQQSAVQTAAIGKIKRKKIKGATRPCREWTVAVYWGCCPQDWQGCYSPYWCWWMLSTLSQCDAPGLRHYPSPVDDWARPDDPAAPRCPAGRSVRSASSPDSGSASASDLRCSSSARSSSSWRLSRSSVPPDWSRSPAARCCWWASHPPASTSSSCPCPVEHEIGTILKLLKVNNLVTHCNEF